MYQAQVLTPDGDVYHKAASTLAAVRAWTEVTVIQQRVGVVYYPSGKLHSVRFRGTWRKAT